MPVETQGYCDPRSRLAREKYFCLRPQPLERWLWSKRIPASAERVFWLHWQEGMQRGDWCSEIPLSRVARECCLDVSTVTRAYQVLSRLECLRRTDQGRDPANPFQQATALTEIRIPRELLVELGRHPNRRANSKPEHLGKRGEIGEDESGDETCTANDALSDRRVSIANRAGEGGKLQSAACAIVEAAARPESRDIELTGTEHAKDGIERRQVADPFQGLTGRERVRALSKLLDSLSASERRAYQEALRMHRGDMAFDVQTRVSAEAQSVLRQILAGMCGSPAKNEGCEASRVERSIRVNAAAPRKLSAFELGRLSRQLQSVSSTAAAPELMRQVVWSIEAGALQRFQVRHALHIALKKIREGRWTRPHRMPPNWVRALSHAPVPEMCGHA